MKRRGALLIQNEDPTTRDGLGKKPPNTAKRAIHNNQQQNQQKTAKIHKNPHNPKKRRTFMTKIRLGRGTHKKAGESWGKLLKAGEGS